MAHTERPIAAEAQRFYRNGTPWLQRLPFWLANLADRMWVVLLAIAAVVIPLSRILPPLYEMRVRSRVFKWYGWLRAVELDQGAARRLSCWPSWRRSTSRWAGAGAVEPRRRAACPAQPHPLGATPVQER